MVGSSLAEAKDPIVYPPQGTQPFLGLDDTSAPTQLQDGRASAIQNIVLDLSKSAQKRPGYSLVAGSQDIIGEDDCAVTGLYYTKFSSGLERIVSTCGSRFNYLNGTVWTTVSGSTVVQTAGANNQFTWTTALDEIIGTNGVDPPLRYDGTNLSTVNFSTLPAADQPTSAKTVAFFKNFLIFGNTTEGGFNYPTRIRWSNVGSTTNWLDASTPHGSYIDIDALGGQQITGMAELYDNLYIFLTSSIYRLSFVAGADTFNVSKVSDVIGCIAKNSIQAVTLTNARQGLIFLGRDKKIYFLDGIFVHDLTLLLARTMNNLSASRLQYAVSGNTLTDYYLCLTNTTSGTNNLCLDYQYQIGEWTKHTQIPANAMANVLDSTGKRQVYFGSTKAFVYKLNDTSLIDDVGTVSGIVSAFDYADTNTASGLQTLYSNTASYTPHALMGAPITLTEGTGSGLTNTIADNTTTGLMVTDAFSTLPDTTTSFQVGAIDAFYTTKWYDCSQPDRLKQFGEVYFWAAAEPTASGITVTYANDLSADIASQKISLSSNANDAKWGSGIWGVSLWGSQSDVFRQVKVDGQGRYFRVKWAEADPNQSFHLYGWSLFYWDGLVN